MWRALLSLWAWLMVEDAASDVMCGNVVCSRAFWPLEGPSNRLA